MKQLTDNRYRTLHRIGGGGMAEVYLAHDEVLDRDVALKVLREQHAEDEEFIERFRREARSAAALSHPNIVQIYDRGECDGTYYIAMEYLPGGTIKDRVRREGALPPAEAADVALQISEALDAAHSRDLVHRDVKPHNILISESGEVKVADFGIARAASATVATATGVILGTAHYISPEQARGEPATARSDLYSLGVVLYEMLTGELPFEAETPVALAVKHVNEPPRPPQEVNPEVPDELNAVVVRLLAKDPADRYGSAAELIRDLERFRHGEPLQEATVRMAALPDASREEESRPRRRGVLPLALAGVLLFLVSALSVVGWGLWESSQRSAEAAGPAEVPDLSGLTLDDARQALGGEFELSVAETRDSAEPEGTILSQDPTGGTSMDVGEEVSVVVSSGQVEVPDVAGQSEDEARQVLEEAGFTVQTQEVASDSVEVGAVISQSPEAGEAAAAGSGVTLAVSTGVSGVEVPDLTGFTVAEASSALEAAELGLGEQYYAPSSTVPEGRIISQEPYAGTEVEPGTEVSVTVSSGQPAPEPSTTQPARPEPSTTQPAQPGPTAQSEPETSGGGTVYYIRPAQPGEGSGTGESGTSPGQPGGGSGQQPGGSQGQPGSGTQGQPDSGGGSSGQQQPEQDQSSSMFEGGSVFGPGGFPGPFSGSDRSPGGQEE
jgi:beta-lactam-binding protein with PASTA domain/tRNA A-37 threonylcarbamoyl transferase component Bud32